MTNSALLVMDIQRGIVDRFPENVTADYLTRVGTAIDAARATGTPVVHVVIGFRAGHPEVSARNKAFGAVAGSAAFVEGDASADIHPALTPQPGDVVVTKKRVSAFAGSDLDMVLRGAGATHLVLAGIATSGVVLSTLRQAADLDFGLTVLSDGCLDGDAEVHRVLTEKVFPRQADVVTVDEWVKAGAERQAG
ncbi:cysteine hydrolase family protein [Streptomyces xanthochromogenes]|uniref:cysteine hydrolase family protein n=1 Tax=Streptomyces xanthochromogenes TaxID=67384 RepID=UPI0038213785